MSFDARALAKRKHIETGFAETEWLQSLENAQLTLKITAVDEAALTQFALASREPAKFTSLARLIYQYTKSHPNGDHFSDAIFKYVNASPFALADWIDAIDFFYGWLMTKKRRADFLPMLEYLECCVAAPDAKEGGETLLVLVEDMLTEFGYDGGKD